MKAELLKSSPVGTIATCHTSDWTQAESLTQRFKRFISVVKLTTDGPIVRCVRLSLSLHEEHRT